MGIKIKRNGSGDFCRVWFARLSRNGRKVERALDVEVAGEIPTNAAGNWDRTAKGDAAFELSRREAEKAFRKLVKGEGNQRKEIRSAETKLLALTGQETGKTQLSSLFDKWESIERNSKPTKRRVDAARLAFAGFAAFADTFAREHGFSCSTLEAVSPELAKAYFKKLSGSLAWGTAREKYGLLRNAWKRWAKSRSTNPFGEIIMRKGEENTGRISRVPLTAEEARRLFEIIEKKRPSLFPLVACAATTGLRLGDACSLKWADVHLAAKAERRRGNFGTIGRERENLRTSKTGAKVILPIIEPFASVLAALEEKRDARDEYVFPDMRERYEREGTRSGLIREIKPFFALAVNPDFVEREADVETLDESGKPKTLDEVLEAVRASRFADAKKERLEKIALEHFAGFKPVKIADDLGLARAQVSEYLRDLEELVGAGLRASTKRRRRLELELDRRSLISKTRQARSVGKNEASIYGWHSLRATFVVLASEAGVPLPYIEKAVGHSTVETTLQYFNPTGKHAAEIIGKRLGATFADPLAVGADPETIDAGATTALEPAKPLTAETALAALTDEERKKLRRRLLEELNMI